MNDNVYEKAFRLSQEEALVLLEILMVYPADLNAEQRAAILKLSDFCREFLRDEGREARDILPIRADIGVPAAVYVA